MYVLVINDDDNACNDICNSDDGDDDDDNDDNDDDDSNICNNDNVPDT